MGEKVKATILVRRMPDGTNVACFTYPPLTPPVEAAGAEVLLRLEAVIDPQNQDERGLFFQEACEKAQELGLGMVIGLHDRATRRLKRPSG